MKQSISIFLILLLFIAFQFMAILAKAENINEFKEGILSYQCSQSGSENIQAWIDGTLTENAGISSEWYILALSQNGDYHFSAYRQALENYIDSHEVYSASTRLKYALVLASVGAKNSPYIPETLSNSIGQQGVMSWIYGLHLLNNGFTCEEYSTDSVIDTLLSLQLADSGWAVMGTNGDIDVTAMAIQSLAPYYNDIPEVHQSIDNAVTFLAEHQKDYGGYTSFGTDNLESTAQVVTALSSIGIDSFSDGRFIKDGHTLLDGMNRYRLPDGSYSHVDNGEMNSLATMQAFYTFVAYERFQQGKSPLYVLDAVQTSSIAPEPTPDELPIENDISQTPQNDTPEIIDNPDAPESVSQNENGHDSEIVPETQNSIATAPISANTSTTVNTSASSTSSSMIINFSDTSAFSTSTISTMVTSVSLQTTFTLSTSVNSSATFSTAPTIMTTAIDSNIENIHDSKLPVKLIMMSFVLICGAVVCVLLFAFKKRNPKNFLFVGIVTAIGIGAVYFIRIESADNYYSDKFDQKNKQGIVTITIRCDTLVGKYQSEYIPQNGIILDVTEIPISEGDTVYKVLTETIQANHIQMEHKENGYIAGINYLYELQYGDLSGWMYRVNGEFPSVGCNEYLLHDGDSIEWLYTCNIGNDLN